MIAFSATFRSLKEILPPHLTSTFKDCHLGHPSWMISINPPSYCKPTNPTEWENWSSLLCFCWTATWSTQSSSTWVLEEGYPVILGDSWRLQKQLICLSLCFSLAHIKMQTSLIPVPSLQTLIWEHLENPSFTGKLQGHPLHLFSRHLQKWPCVILKAQHLQ